MIKIFVVCHKPAYVLQNPLLCPIQVGAALSEKRLEGMIGDDEGKHISEKNPRYCELTAQYWAWKNCDAEYYGFFHYRRYLSFAKAYEVNPDGALNVKKAVCPYEELDDIRGDLSAYRLEQKAMEQLIRQYDLITVMRERLNVTVYQQYCQYHDPTPLDDVLSVIEKRYPQYWKAAKCYMNSKEVYYLNMFIMKKTVYMEYMSWLFDILETYEQSSDYTGFDGDKNRLMGYLAERLFGIFYVYQRQKGLHCAELTYLRFYDTDPDGAAGRQDRNIRVFRLKPTKIEIKIDMRMFNKMFPAGSKRRILLRSIFLR